MATGSEKNEIRLFGVAEDVLRRELVDVLDSHPEAVLSFSDGEARLSLSTEDPAAWSALESAVSSRFGAQLFTRCGESLEQQVVQRLSHHGKTVATAESCTGGLVSAQLTGVPGSSRVFGTGVVSYAPCCKEKLLGVSPDTLATEGTVCAAVAGQMARGVRQVANADIGVAVTGEAGPQAAEDVPVGTVFVALADARRTWVWELHLTGDRQSIRQQAAGQVLFSLYRYLEAYPTVMAGGTSNRVAQRTIPRTQGADHPRLVTRLLPWRGDTWRTVLAKCLAWMLILSVLAGGVALLYRYLLLAPDTNRQLQDALGDLYWSTDLTQDGEGGDAYPPGMLAQFHGLYDRNPAVAGWIQIPDTAVDYPVMFYEDGYYKNHNFNGEYSLYGQPYLSVDALPDSEAEGYHPLVIYGKNTEDGQMFSDLLNYRRIAFLQEHPVLEMNTVTTAGRWEVFAVLVVDERRPAECAYAQTAFTDEPSYAAYLEMLQQRSLFHSNQPATTRDEVLLLSVNAEEVYRYTAARLVVAARRITGEERDVVYRVNQRAQLPAVLTTTARTGRTTRTITSTLLEQEDTTTTSITTTSTTTTQSAVATSGTTVGGEGSATVSSATETTVSNSGATSSTQETTRPSQGDMDKEETPEETEGENYGYIGD